MGVMAIEGNQRATISNHLSVIGEDIVEIETELINKGYRAFVPLKECYRRAISPEIESMGFSFYDYYRERAKEKIASVSLCPIPIRANGFVSELMEKGRMVEIHEGRSLGFGSPEVRPYHLEGDAHNKSISEAVALRKKEGLRYSDFVGGYRFDSIADRKTILTESISVLSGRRINKVSAMRALMTQRVADEWHLALLLPTMNFGTPFSNAMLDFRMCLMRANDESLYLRVGSMADVFHIRLDEAIIGFHIYRVASSSNEIALSIGSFVELFRSLGSRVSKIIQ